MLCLIFLSACQKETRKAPQGLPPLTEAGLPAEAAVSGQPETFEDVLREYLALTRRLSKVSYPLARANTALCPKTLRAIGATVHVIEDYPQPVQPFARALIGASDTLSIRTVIDGGPAQRAGLLAGDEILQIGDNHLPSGRSAKSFYEGLARWQFDDARVIFKLRRAGRSIEAAIDPETLCGYPVHIYFSEQVNGLTDGQEIWITSELIRQLPDDDSLALIIAHEMAHIIAGHADKTPTIDMELEADRMALILMARAGFDIERAVANWQQIPPPHISEGQDRVHPNAAARHAGFTHMLSVIKASGHSGQDLNFDLLAK